MDAAIFRLVVCAITAVCLFCIGGMVVLAAQGRLVPDALGTIAGTTAGALVGILITPQRYSDGPAPKS